MNDATPVRKMVQSGLTRRQRTALRKGPPSEQIRTRREADKDLAYLEGWYVISEANRIFGPENWDRITLTTQCVWQGRTEGGTGCAYTARVRICIRAGHATLVREGCGFGQARGREPGEAHGMAVKAAETDATKRALATLGAPFGLNLYAHDQACDEGTATPAEGTSGEHGKTCKPPHQNGACGLSTHANDGDLTRGRTPTVPWLVYDAVGEIAAVFKDPIRYCSALRRMIEGADTAGELEVAYAANRRTLRRLIAEKPELRSDADQHYAEILSSLFQARLKRLSTPN